MDTTRNRNDDIAIVCDALTDGDAHASYADDTLSITHITVHDAIDQGLSSDEYITTLATTLSRTHSYLGTHPTYPRCTWQDYQHVTTLHQLMPGTTGFVHTSLYSTVAHDTALWCATTLSRSIYTDVIATYGSNATHKHYEAVSYDKTHLTHPKGAHIHLAQLAYASRPAHKRYIDTSTLDDSAQVSFAYPEPVSATIEIYSHAHNDTTLLVIPRAAVNSTRHIPTATIAAPLDTAVQLTPLPYYTNEGAAIDATVIAYTQ